MATAEETDCGILEVMTPPRQTQVDHPFKFIDGCRKGGKVLVYNGYLFHLNSKMKQTAYFKCSEKRKGCMAGITLKNYNPSNSTFDSFVITNTTHVNHVADPDKVIRREEKHLVRTHLTNTNLYLYCTVIINQRFGNFRRVFHPKDGRD